MQATAQKQQRDFDSDGQRAEHAAPEVAQAPESPAKKDADKKAGVDAASQMADDAITVEAGPEEQGFAEAGEKAGDKGTTTVEMKLKLGEKEYRVPKGTTVVVKEVRGEQLVVILPGYNNRTATIPSASFALKQAGQKKPDDKTPAPPVKPEPQKPLDPMKDPKVNPDPTNEYAPKAAYGEVKGVIGVKGAGDSHEFASNDVEQGSLGDCYFVAQLAAQAKSNPDRIKDLIKDNGDGTYTVSLYLKDQSKPWGPRVKKDIVVDSQFPQDNGNVAYAKPGDKSDKGPELWVMLIEKAFAKYSGSYEQIRGSKTKDGDVFAMMSGTSSESFSPSAVGADKTIEKLEKAVAGKQPVSFGAKTKTGLDEKGQAEAKAAGVVLNHAYSLEGVDGKAKTVSLRNPWGVKHLDNFSIENVLKFYSSVDIGAK